jgi:hypothetical protein
LDNENSTLIKGQYNLKENNMPAMVDFFTELKTKGLSPVSLTIDGNPTVIKAAKHVWPDLIIQRCLVHIQRQGLAWCRVMPKTTSAKKLRQLFVILPKIKTLKERDIFLSEVKKWEIKYGEETERRPEKGKVFSDLKRSRSMLLKALPYMFWFIENNSIPSTTNLAEGYFSFLKSRYRSHRGLSPKRRRAFFEWFFQLKH